MTKRLIVLLFTVVMGVQVWAQSVAFICGHTDHNPRHEAATLDDAKALAKRQGCIKWTVTLTRGDTGNSMPAYPPNSTTAILLRAKQIEHINREFADELTDLNEFASATIGASTWTQLKPENVEQQPFNIVVTSTQTNANLLSFRITVALSAAMPVLHGYLAVPQPEKQGLLGYFTPAETFVEIQRNLQGGTAIYEFDYPPKEMKANPASRFSLADVPLDQEGRVTKNIYWFYLRDFENR